MNASRDSWPEDSRHQNAGWIAGGLVILLVLLVGAALWFTYHP
jgi:hypothetical protein